MCILLGRSEPLLSFLDLPDFNEQLLATMDKKPLCPL